MTEEKENHNFIVLIPLQKTRFSLHKMQTEDQSNTEYKLVTNFYRHGDINVSDYAAIHQTEPQKPPSLLCLWPCTVPHDALSPVTDSIRTMRKTEM